MRQRIIRADGDTQSSFSGSCPKCCDPRIEKQQVGGHDFDENGWFYRFEFTCQSPGCGHKWSERQVIQQNGRYLR